MTAATPPVPEDAPPEASSTTTSGPLIVGGLLLAVGAVLLWQAVAAGVDNGVTLGGPTLAPIVVTALWVAVALWYLLEAARKRAKSEAGTVAWRTPLFLLVALIVYAVVLKYTVLGYVLSTAAFVLVSARLLSTRPIRAVIVRDLVTAAALSVGIYLVFTRLLGIVLPAGVLPL
ncbi:tripartite tricarboxylate transporter TctB family protein [Dactylosporangium sp. NBC_01737]|uniref:tripartite tricarboxylate transporter TctB family protein n=1 Tax=Dactylosporangium sp. NBC_01737 TaxID=2975959 RepID=UPI002E13134A|nr:tripartite tricarboxylate transporter TctB family protein [Dactylosporangium sp. NBC_01737]